MFRYIIGFHEILNTLATPKLLEEETNGSDENLSSEQALACNSDVSANKSGSGAPTNQASIYQLMFSMRDRCLNVLPVFNLAG